MAENLQQAFYSSERDYVKGSPHLQHRQLNRLLLDLVIRTAESALVLGLPPNILEIGGGDGAITELLLARGFAVTSTEMSEPSVERLHSKFGRNPEFRAVFDPDGSLAALGSQRFGCVLFASVLHHIPDYLGALHRAVDSFLLPRGALVTIQDPLWYPRLSPWVRRASTGSYLTWRICQGEFMHGLQTRLRRATKGLSDSVLSDTVEYHVVRDGVDELAVAEQLQGQFRQVRTISYWSTQGAVQQRVGEAVGIQNTFAISATDSRLSLDVA